MKLLGEVKNCQTWCAHNNATADLWQLTNYAIFITVNVIVAIVITAIVTIVKKIMAATVVYKANNIQTFVGVIIIYFISI